jgi:integrase
MDYLEGDEMLRLLKAAKQAGPREHAMVLVGYVHGCRADEVCGLRIEDVDLQAETIIAVG